MSVRAPFQVKEMAVRPMPTLLARMNHLKFVMDLRRTDGGDTI